MKSSKSFLKFFKGLFNSKLFVISLLFFFVFASDVFAADTIESLNGWGDNILKIFASNWVKALACVALIIEAIGMVVAGQQGGGGQIIKKFAPWLIGTVVLLSASGITSYFLKDLKFDDYSSMITVPQEIEFVDGIA